MAAIYTGVAIAALNFAKQFADRHQPLPLPRPIKYLPGVQFAVAEAEALLAATRAYTFETAKAWVNGEPFLGEEGLVRVCMPKYVATNNAIRIVYLAMEIAEVLEFSKNIRSRLLLSRCSRGNEPSVLQCTDAGTDWQKFARY